MGIVCSFAVSSQIAKKSYKNDFFTQLKNDRDSLLLPPPVHFMAKEKLLFIPPYENGPEESIRFFELNGIFFIDGVFFGSHYTEEVFKRARLKESLKFFPKIERRIFIVSDKFYTEISHILVDLEAFEYSPPMAHESNLLYDDTPLYFISLNGNERKKYALTEKSSATYENMVWRLFSKIAINLQQGCFDEADFGEQLDKIASH